MMNGQIKVTLRLSLVGVTKWGHKVFQYKDNIFKTIAHWKSVKQYFPNIVNSNNSIL